MTAPGTTALAGIVYVAPDALPTVPLAFVHVAVVTDQPLSAASVIVTGVPTVVAVYA